MTPDKPLSAAELEALRAVYTREQPNHSAWPTTFEKMMADPVLSRVLMLLHKHPKTHQVPRQQPTRVPWPFPSKRYAMKTSAVDLKKRAAGDKDE